MFASPHCGNALCTGHSARLLDRIFLELDRHAGRDVMKL